MSPSSICSTPGLSRSRWRPDRVLIGGAGLPPSAPVSASRLSGRVRTRRAGPRAHGRCLWQWSGRGSRSRLDFPRPRGCRAYSTDQDLAESAGTTFPGLEGIRSGLAGTSSETRWRYGYSFPPSVISIPRQAVPRSEDRRCDPPRVRCVGGWLAARRLAAWHRRAHSCLTAKRARSRSWSSRPPGATKSVASAPGACSCA